MPITTAPQIGRNCQDGSRLSAGTTRDTPFRTLLETSSTEHFFERTSSSAPSERRPTFFFYTVQPRDLWQFVLHASRQTADYKVNKPAGLFGLVAISIVATLVILALPPLVFGRTAARAGRQTGVACTSYHWRRLHFDSGRADSEVRAVSRASDLCADGDHLFDAVVERIRQLSQQAASGTRGEFAGGLIFVTAAVLVLARSVGPVRESGVSLPLASRFSSR